jgi:serine/threonine protein kinase
VLSVLEASALVWTDMRPQNFVTLARGRSFSLKAIDWESAVPQGSRPVDCTPETTPPETAALYVSGALGRAVVGPQYDVWSFGLLVLFMATGRLFFEDEAPARVMQRVATLTQAQVDARIAELAGRDRFLVPLLGKILRVDPQERPTLGKIRRQWFFLSPF